MDTKMDKKPFWLVLLALIPLLVVGPALLSGESIGPFDQIAQMQPWGAEPTGRAWDVLQADGVLQFYIWRDLVFEGWRTGQVPFWNPHQLGGTPLLANSQSAPLYPPHILASVFPTPLALNLLAWFHLALGALGVRALTRRLGATEPGAALAGAIFALSPFMVAWTVLPSVITTCAYIPWILSHLVGVFQHVKKSGPLLALSIALLMLGGHLQFAFYGLLAALVAGLWLAAASSKQQNSFAWKPAALSLGATVLGLALCMVQLMPVQAFSKYSHRQATATKEGYQAYVAGAVKPFELVGVVAPGFFGTPGVPEADVESATPYPTYWPQFVKPGANYAESAVTLGPAVLLGLFLLRRKLNWTQAGAVAAVGLLGLLLALGTSVNALLYFGVPGFAATGSPGRATVLFVLAACVLAGLAIGRPTEELREHQNQKYSFWPVAATVVVALLAIVGMNSLGTLETWIPGTSVAFQVARRLTETLPVLLISLALTAGAWFLLTKKQQPLPAAGALLLAHLTIAQAFILPHGKLPQTDLPDPQATQRYAFINGPWDFLSAAPALMPPNTATAYRLNDIAGYDSLLHKDTVALLKEINNGQDPAPPVNGNIMYVKDDFDLDALRAAGVTEIWAQTAIGHPELEWQDQGGYLTAQTNGPGLLTTPLLDGEVTKSGLNAFTIQATGPGELVFRQRNLEGWQATINGQPVPLKPSDWLTIDLPEGEAHIEFWYEPPGFSTGFLITMLAFLGWVAWFAITLRRINPVPENQPENNPATA